ncbi:hypothetical protein PMNALOAF_3990 [Methylobacterium adhaesivum]|uniref:SIR2 family protein n=1 Tax=Methylobacterium adhaesivum TaxID=333297 RepID=A0ABT8BJG6_9HYPH|nr:SIR2 family protein [Methylobacterium adhaesivum]MDN3591441.1 SIR2 family protein [Methylobacterium adhaesivum]GJD32713.1 hypothetical protein PMNALOAF_3990 [Methylobacterium adhaesivum]
MSKRKLLIVVGAGASLDFGLPSVSDVDRILDARAAALYPLASDPTSNLYRYCRNEIDAYYKASPKPALRNWTNFEEVLYQLNLLSPYFGDPSHVRGSNALLSPVDLPDVLVSGAKRAVDSDIIKSLTSALIDELVDSFIDKCSNLPSIKSREIAEVNNFLSVLRKEFDVGIMTLNYDNVFEQADPNLFTGFDPATGVFDASSVFARGQWDFVYHLHGSIHFAMTGTSSAMHGITWRKIPTKDAAVHASGRNLQDTAEGTDYPISPIVAGYGKTNQTLRQPFRTYFAQANRIIHEADALMFIGYGFGDLHLNAVFSDISNRRRPTLVVDWASNDQDPLQFRHDNWTYNLFRTIPANAFEMAEPGHKAAPDVADLKSNNQVEHSINPNYPLAVWYNGFLEACRNINKLLPHLR